MARARALLAAIAEGRAIAALGRDPAGPVRRRSWSAARHPRLAELVPSDAAEIGALSERGLGADQSNSSSVLGETVLLKTYRRLEPGLNPELELVAFLTEEAGFGGRPAARRLCRDGLRGRARRPRSPSPRRSSPTGVDAYESIAESLTAWLLAPGEVSVEFATEVAADLGTLTAGMHAALANAPGIPDFEPRPATRDELRRWGRAARTAARRAPSMSCRARPAALLRDLAPRIVEELTRLRGAVQPAAGDPGARRLPPRPGPRSRPTASGSSTSRASRFARSRSVAPTRAPLRDVASMLRSLDHVGRSARPAGGGPERRAPRAAGSRP